MVYVLDTRASGPGSSPAGDIVLCSCIHYLHNTIMHLFNPPAPKEKEKKLHTHCLQFLLGHEHVPKVI